MLFFWHYFANLCFTLMTNVLYDINLTDMETCYKAFLTEKLKAVPLESERFGIEAEITAKVCKRRLRLYEVPISYSGRTYAEQEDHLEGRLPISGASCAIVPGLARALSLSSPRPTGARAPRS